MTRIGELEVVTEWERTPLLATLEARDDAGGRFRVRALELDLDLAADDLAVFERDMATLRASAPAGVLVPSHWATTAPIYVATAYKPAISLRDLFSDGEGVELSLSEALGVSLDTARALEAAHAENLVHGGVAPRHVYLDVSGRCSVTDFGLARLVAASSPRLGQIERSAVDAVAPEQTQASGTATIASDVFTLGMVVYRALTGRRAVEAPSDLGAFIRLSMGQVDPLGPKAESLPRGLGSFVMKMLSADPQKRPTMVEVVAELRRHLGDAVEWRQVLALRVRERLEARGELVPPEPSPPVSSGPSSSGPASSGAAAATPARRFEPDLSAGPSLPPPMGEVRAAAPPSPFDDEDLSVELPPGQEADWLSGSDTKLSVPSDWPLEVSEDGGMPYVSEGDPEVDAMVRPLAGSSTLHDDHPTIRRGGVALEAADIPDFLRGFEPSESDSSTDELDLWAVNASDAEIPVPKTMILKDPSSASRAATEGTGASSALGSTVSLPSDAFDLSPDAPPAPEPDDSTSERPTVWLVVALVALLTIAGAAFLAISIAS